MNYSIEDFDNIKTKMLKYILYKKRTEQEVRLKFSNENYELLNDAIDYLKEVGYINDNAYISRAINEYISLKNLSITEIRYKLLSKGIEKSKIDEYIYSHNEELLQYELNSIKKIILKKSNILESKELTEFLLKKGFKIDTINQVINERYNENE